MSDKYEIVTHVVHVTAVVEMSCDHYDIRGADVRVCSPALSRQGAVPRTSGSMHPPPDGVTIRRHILTSADVM